MNSKARQKPTKSQSWIIDDSFSPFTRFSAVGSWKFAHQPKKSQLDLNISSATYSSLVPKYPSNMTPLPRSRLWISTMAIHSKTVHAMPNSQVQSPTYVTSTFQRVRILFCIRATINCHDNLSRQWKLVCNLLVNVAIVLLAAVPNRIELLRYNAEGPLLHQGHGSLHILAGRFTQFSLKGCKVYISPGRRFVLAGGHVIGFSRLSIGF